MLHFIYGAGGSGKTHCIYEAIKADIAAGRRAFLLVPEQQAVITERESADILPASAPLYFEVLNFSRLANSVFRQYGGLSYKYATKGTKSLLMWRALSELSPFLKEYKNSGTECKNVPFMLFAHSELRAYSVSAEKLGSIADKLQKDTPAQRKFADIALVCAFYEALLKEKYADTASDLDMLAKKLAETDFFAGANVYIDSFSSFTTQELSILEGIFASALNTTVAFSCDSANGRELHFGEVYDTIAKLKSIAARRGFDINEKKLSGNKRANSAALAYLQEHIWALGTPSDFEHAEKMCGSVRVVECPDSFSEAEFVASDLLSRVQNGARYRDFAIITRNTADYEGVIDAIFDKYKIPYFMSVPSELQSKPLIKLILSALAIIAGNWRHTDVMTYIKTGLCNLTAEESDIFEDYTSTWKIQGRRYTDGILWNMNPDGYRSELTERGNLILHRVNEIRERIVPPLEKLSDSLRGTVTYKDACCALVDFLTELDIQNRLKTDAQKAQDGGNIAYAAELLQVWNILISAIDSSVDAIGEFVVNAATYQKLLTLALSEIDISNIPTTADEVVVGGADLLRTGEKKHIYIIGAVEGRFPAALKDDGVFTDSDKQLLLEYGVQLSADLSVRAARELFYFYRATSSASDSITVSYPAAELTGGAQKPSMAVERILHLFTVLEPLVYNEMPIIQRLYEKETSFEYISVLSGTPEESALRRLYSTDKDSQYKLSLTQIPLSKGQLEISPALSQELYSGEFSLTPSRLDTYVRCHFMYMCRYILKLREPPTSDFGLLDIGNFIHHILEKIVYHIAKGEDDIETLANRTIKEYISSVFPKEQEGSARLYHLLSRLNRSIMLLVSDLTDELDQSKFKPRFFEFNIQNPLVFELKDGTKVSLRGKIDRVDIYKKDGDIYLRVIDYKTGRNDFSLSDFEKGQKLQLVLYLFTLWRAEAEQLLRECGAEGGRVIPAGMLYYSAKPPNMTLPNYTEDSEAVITKALKEFSRKGILLDDIDVLRAMDSNLSGKYLPVKQNKNGSLSNQNLLFSYDGINGLYTDIKDIFVGIAEQLYSGDISAIPTSEGGKLPCDYCAMNPVCRVEARELKKREYGGDDFSQDYK